MAGNGPEDLHAAAAEFLAAVEAALDTIPEFAAGLGGAPQRSFVAPGSPAYDCCPQTTVHLGLHSEGATAPGTPKASTARINRVAFIATVIRCLPQPSDGTPADEEDMDAAAEQIHADRWALWNHVWNLIRDEQLFTRCQDVQWGGLAPVTPQGGCGGSILTVTAALDGYEEAFGT
jgi:hypothetical protein